MDYARIGKIEAIFLVCILLLNHLILNLPKSIFAQSGTSSIINIILVCAVAFLFCMLLVKIFSQFPGKDLIDISEFLGGKVLKTGIGICYFLFFLMICSTFLRNFSESIRLTFLQTTNIAIILLGFLVVTAIATYFGNKAIVRCNLIIAPIMILTLIITFLSVSPNFVWERIFPVLGYGINETFLSGLSNIFALNGLCVLFFLPPLLKDKMEYKKVTYLSLLVLSILLLLSITCFLLGLPIIFSMDQLSPAYILVRSAQFGSFFQRPEAMFILFWILAFLSFLCVFAMFMILLLQKLLRLKHGKGIHLAVVSLIFIAAMLPKNIAQTLFMESTIYKYVSLILIYGISLPILILAYWKKKRKSGKKEGELENE